MAINFKLSTRKPEDPETSPWGRTWIGWDPDESLEAVWAANRGVWNLGERATAEHYATMSFQGTVRLVARITGKTLVPYNHGSEAKFALEGQVLLPGHPVREALLGRAVDSFRNPVTYPDTSDVDLIDPPTTRYFAINRDALLLDIDGAKQAMEKTARGGEFETAILIPQLGLSGDLQLDDVVLVIDGSPESVSIVTVAYVAGGAGPATSTRAGGGNREMPVSLWAIPSPGDELVPTNLTSDEVWLLRERSSATGELAGVLAEQLLDEWQAHLESIGWWGSLDKPNQVRDAYAEEYRSATAPTQMPPPDGIEATSAEAFNQFASSYDGPTALAMAHVYLQSTGLAPEDYSTSTYVDTGDDQPRRALAIEVGPFGAFVVMLDQATGEITDWVLRVGTHDLAYLRRWLDLTVTSGEGGPFLVGDDPRTFFRSISDEVDQPIIRQGAEELVKLGDGRRPRLQKLHNPHLESAILNPPRPPAT